MRTFKLQHINQVSAGLIFGGVSAGLTFLASVLALFALPIFSFNFSNNFFGLTGMAALIFMPLVQGALGFIQGFIGAFIFNFVAERTGGLEIGLQGQFGDHPLSDYDDVLEPGNH